MSTQTQSAILQGFNSPAEAKETLAQSFFRKLLTDDLIDESTRKEYEIFFWLYNGTETGSEQHPEKETLLNSVFRKIMTDDCIETWIRKEYEIFFWAYEGLKSNNSSDEKN